MISVNPPGACVRRTAKQARQGFTLMEVMIAVAILALALTAIFSSEAGAIKAAHRSRQTGTATLLARCKMNEVEEQVMNEGLPAVDDIGSDQCCVDGEIEGFRCEWEIKRIVLPDDIFSDSSDDEDGAGMLENLVRQSDAPDDAPTGKDDDPRGAGDDGILGNNSIMGSSIGDSAMDMLAGGGADGMSELALQFTYPILKPAFEEQIRRATVRVMWNEGTQVKSFEVVQFLVAEQPPKIPGQEELMGAGEPGQGAQGQGQGSQGQGQGSQQGTGTQGAGTQPGGARPPGGGGR